MTLSGGQGAALPLTVVRIGLPRITPCKPISRISRSTVQRATPKPSRCNCRHSLRPVAWAVAHLSEREAMFARTDLFATALAWRPGAVTMAAAEREVAALEKAGKLHPAVLAVPGGVFTTDKAVADERETISLMQTGQGRGAGTRR